MPSHRVRTPTEQRRYVCFLTCLKNSRLNLASFNDQCLAIHMSQCSPGRRPDYLFAQTLVWGRSLSIAIAFRVRTHAHDPFLLILLFPKTGQRIGPKCCISQQQNFFFLGEKPQIPLFNTPIVLSLTKNYLILVRKSRTQKHYPGRNLNGLSASQRRILPYAYGEHCVHISSRTY